MNKKFDETWKYFHKGFDCVHNGFDKIKTDYDSSENFNTILIKLSGQRLKTTLNLLKCTFQMFFTGKTEIRIKSKFLS